MAFQSAGRFQAGYYLKCRLPCSIHIRVNTDLFEKTSVPRAYMTLALPVVLSMLVSMVYNLVDTFFVAHTGNTAMVAGVSLAAPLFTVMIALGDIFGLGGSSVISRLFGQHKFDVGKRVSAFCFWASIVCGLCVVVLGLIFRDPILRLLGADYTTWEHVKAFYTVIIIGAPLIIASLTPSNLLRVEGHAKPAMVGSVTGTIVNIILNPLFIAGFGWGAAGSALASVIGYAVQDVYFVWFLIRKSQALSVLPSLARISRRHISEMFSIGLPASVTNLMQSLGIVMTNLFLLNYGDNAVAAMGIALKIVSVAVLLLVALAFGGQPLIGYTFGAHDSKRLGEILRFAVFLQVGVALVLTAALSIPARWIMSLFISNAEVITMGTSMLRWQLASTILVGVIMVLTVTFQSAGKALPAFIMSITRQGAALAVTLWVGSSLFGYNGVIAAQPSADLITAVLGGVIFWMILGKSLFGKDHNARTAAQKLQ